MAKNYGKPVTVTLELRNPKSTIIMGATHLGFTNEEGKEVGSISVDIAGRGARVKVDGEDYDLDFSALWNEVVKQIGKPEYVLSSE